jgi:hypothetical protein
LSESADPVLADGDFAAHPGRNWNNFTKADLEAYHHRAFIVAGKIIELVTLFRSPRRFSAPSDFGSV